MAFAEFNFYSKSLQMDVQVSLILPEKVQGVGSAPAIRYGNFPVLYLLHGTSGDHTDWERWTSIERYAAKKGLAVVMPAAQLSAYTNMVHGERYFDYIAYELPEKISKLLPISCCREDTYLCGLSMGGYGALKIGLTLPENYAAIGTLSNGNHAYMAAGKVGSEALPKPFGRSHAQPLPALLGMDSRTPCSRRRDRPGYLLAGPKKSG